MGSDNDLGYRQGQGGILRQGYGEEFGKGSSRVQVDGGELENAEASYVIFHFWLPGCRILQYLVSLSVLLVEYEWTGRITSQRALTDNGIRQLNFPLADTSLRQSSDAFA